MNGKPIKVILRVHNHEKTQQREFSSLYEAQGALELMHKNDPDLIIESHVKLSDSCEIEISHL
jgi:two-component SAPR family response regulator